MPRVLIVEDDPQLGSELCADLETLGYQVRWVRDAVVGGPEAAVVHGDRRRS